MEPDFSGYATKAGLKCSDGRTIMKDAFAHQDSMTVPLVWHHRGNTDPENILGHAILHAVDGDIRTDGYFNSTAKGQAAKQLVEHGDVTWLSIYANQLVERAKQVFHGMIGEVSLVMAGANPGAKIDYVAIQHADGSIEEPDDEAVITTGLALEAHLEHAAAPSASPETLTVQDVYDTLDDNQKELVSYLVEEAVAAVKDEAGLAHSADEQQPEGSEGDQPEGAAEPVDQPEGSEGDQPEGAVDSSDDTVVEDAPSDTAPEGDQPEQQDTNNGDESLAHQEGSDTMTRNVFDQSAGEKPAARTHLTHEQINTIVTDAQRVGSFKDAVLMHAGDYGIDDIDMLFPDAQAVTQTPEFLSRRMEWVASVLDGAKHSPFSRIKSVHADITAEEARARGYVKGNLKKNEIFSLLKRVTTPTTIYKKQKLDRDDIVDITDFDVVAWLKAEMRMMLEEELARAILVGDGREPDDEDKIDEARIRPIAYDDDMYSHKVTVPANTTADGYVESIMRSRKFYKGTGQPTFYTTDDILTDMLMIKNKIGDRVYKNVGELSAVLRVSNVVVVEILESYPDIVGILVSISDYTIGADRGGALAMFDDFDIDYNQQKYLMETRLSGALTKAKSAVVIAATHGTLVTASVPTYNPTTHVLAIPAVAGVTYVDTTDPLDPVTLSTGNHTLTQTTDVEAHANTGYHFGHNTDNDWTFAYTA